MATSIFIRPGSGTFVGGVLAVGSGGTGLSSYAIGDLIVATAATTLASLADVAVGQVLVSGGVGVAPAYSANPTVTSVVYGTGGTLSSGGASGKVQITGTTPMFQLGGTTASFPALKTNSTTLQAKKADDSGFTDFQANSFSLGSTAGLYYMTANIWASGTAPTVTSAGSSPSVASNNGSLTFRVNVGTGGTATTIVMSMPTAATGWNAYAENITGTAANRADKKMVMTASTTASVTLQYQTVSTGAAVAFTASDIVAVIAVAF